MAALTKCLQSINKVFTACWQSERYQSVNKASGNKSIIKDKHIKAYEGVERRMKDRSHLLNIKLVSST